MELGVKSKTPIFQFHPVSFLEGIRTQYKWRSEVNLSKQQEGEKNIRFRHMSKGSGQFLVPISDNREALAAAPPTCSYKIEVWLAGFSHTSIVRCA